MGTMTTTSFVSMAVVAVVVAVMGGWFPAPALTNAARISAKSPTPAPEPAPGLSEFEYVNLTQLLTLSGPFHTFLSHLESTQVLQTFQNEANNSQHGITIFVPQDKAFSSLNNPSLSNLSKDQLRSLLLFHALPNFYALADFNHLTHSNPVPTYAGASYTLNFTYYSGNIGVSSGWSYTTITSSVHASQPVAVYQVDKVLLPRAIFGNPPPQAPAPASKSLGPSASESATTAAPEASSKSEPTSSSTAPSSPCYRIITYFVLAVSGGLVVLL